MNHTCSTIAALALGFCLAAQSGTSRPASPARSSDHAYTMRVELDPAHRSLSGEQTIRWRNTTSASTDELRFHLYWNAFRDRDSTFLREAGARVWREDDFGSIRIDALALERKPRALDLTSRLEFVQPDDANPHDATVVRVALPEPIAPGESITLKTRFSAKVPKAHVRTGFIPDDGFFCMHWFPKLGVLADAGPGRARWKCHQFHATTEFFADFADYDVSIVVPEQYVVGATGRKLTPTTFGLQKTWHFVQEAVHDFAWVADPDFRLYRKIIPATVAAQDPTGVAPAVAKTLGVPVESFDLPEVEIELLLQPEHDTEEQRLRHLEAVRRAIEFFGLRFGAYPYPRITVVDPGSDFSGRSLGGGMEYPMLITGATPLWLHERELAPEHVLVHEFGHQYWYGLSANDESEESWLDEGINTFCEGRAQTLLYDPQMRPVATTRFGLVPLAVEAANVQPSLGSLRLPLEWAPPEVRQWSARLRWEGIALPASPVLDVLRTQPTLAAFREARQLRGATDRTAFLAGGTLDALVRPGWLYLDRKSYGVNSYMRPATLLRTLERLVGHQKFWTFLRTFAMRARFTHPTTADFERTLAEVCGADVAAFFTAARAAQADFDYGIESVSPPDGRGQRKEVVIRRTGALRADVRIRFTFAGKPPVYREFPAREIYPWQRFTFDEPARLLEVWVDPPEGVASEADQGAVGAYLLDANLLDNGWRAEVDPRPALYRGLRWLLRAQSELTFVTGVGG